MEYQRRRITGSTASKYIWKAIAAGMVLGVALSMVGFYHRWKLEALRSELLGDIHYQEAATGQERRTRELAEQMQAEADSERTMLQDQLKELGSAVLEAKQREEDIRKAAERVRQEASKANEERKDALSALRASMLKINQLESKLRNEEDHVVTSATDRHTPWMPSKERDRADLELAALLRKVARNNEVMLAISNRNYAGQGSMLDLWIRNVQYAGVKNAMVVALDQETRAFAEAQGVASLVMSIEIADSQKHVGQNHAVSGLKFKILQRFLELGYAVLLSDVDIITLQDPFQHLFRDSDVEAMSDGWDNATAYGYNDVADDPSMGWARYAHSMRVFCFNSGLFYIRPTPAAMQLLRQVMHRIETEAGWDQAIFNEVIFFPSHNQYVAPSVTRRVMDIYRFMNSKVLFKQVRYQQGLKAMRPVTVHANYHPNKLERLVAVEKLWVGGDMDALKAFPEGS